MKHVSDLEGPGLEWYCEGEGGGGGGGGVKAGNKMWRIVCEGVRVSGDCGE